MKDPVKNYFTEEVDSLSVPAFPGEMAESLKHPPKENRDRRRGRFQWKDTMALAACLAFVLFTLARPASFDTPVRNISVSPERLNEATSNISRVLIEAAAEM